MPDYNLSSANLGRVANQPVDLLRIANQIVWEANTFVDEAFVFPPPPVENRNLNDGQELTLGLVWGTTAEGTWIGNRIYTPTSVVDVIRAAAYNLDSSSLLGSKMMSTPATDRLVDIIFDEPLTVLPGVNYLAAYHSTAAYVATPSPGQTWPVTTAHLYTPSSAIGRWRYGSMGLPENSTNSHYHVSPIVRF